MAGLLASPSTPVVVTGGGSGIGRESARALAEAGRPIAAWDLNADGAAETAAICADLGVATFSAAVDVRDLDAVRAAVAGTLDALGGVGGLVHAAGVPMGFTGDDLGTDEFRLVLSVNLEAEAVLVRELLPALRDGEPRLGDRGHLVDRGTDRPRQHPRVHGVEARAHRTDPVARGPARTRGHPGQRGVPGLHRHADVPPDRRGEPRGPRRASSAGSPSAASATPRRSAASCASCCPTTRATSTAARSWPTAA